MIVLRLMGGLGNQLFQYAAGRQLAERLRTSLVLDTRWYAEDPGPDTRRHYGLGIFDIRAEPGEAKSLAQLGNADFSWPGRLYTRLRSLGKFRKAKFYDPGFDPAFLQLRDNIYLKGYFQSTAYFESILPQLRHELRFREQARYEALAGFSQIRESLSVSLHVRRGDYVGQSLHPVCTRAYYEKALARMAELLHQEFRVFVFSDDLAWAKSALDIPKAVFVDNSAAELPDADLFLMSCCKHHILANSTYSWWGAWLNASPEKHVIAPEYWMDGYRTTDLGLNIPQMHIIS